MIREENTNKTEGFGQRGREKEERCTKRRGRQRHKRVKRDERDVGREKEKVRRYGGGWKHIHKINERGRD